MEVPVLGTGVHSYGDVVVLHAQTENAHNVWMGDASEERGTVHKPGNLLIMASFFEPWEFFLSMEGKKKKVDK